MSAGQYKPGVVSSRPRTAPREWLVVLASLVDDALVSLAVLFILWLFGVPITLPIILGLVAAAVVLTIVTRCAVVPVLRRRIVIGVEDMIGAEGEALENLNPGGMVKVRGEYWRARAVEGKISQGERIQVTAVNGLTLEVIRKK